MKKLFIIMLTILFGMSVTAQQLTKQDYLLKSKNQKTAAWIFTGGGAAMIIAGLVSQGSDQSFFPNQEVGTALLVAGGAAVVTGVVFFNASNRNLKKANEKDAALNLKMEKAVVVQNGSLQNNYFPALSLKIRLQ